MGLIISRPLVFIFFPRKRERTFQFQADIHTKDIFLHLWSIAVEIQFYLIVPFIFLLLQIFKKKKLKIVILLIVCSISYGIYYYSNPIFSFNSCLSRMWQFGLGMLAFISMDKHVAQTHSKYIHSIQCFQFKKNEHFSILQALSSFLPHSFQVS